MFSCRSKESEPVTIRSIQSETHEKEQQYLTKIKGLNDENLNLVQAINTLKENIKHLEKANEEDEEQQRHLKNKRKKKKIFLEFNMRKVLER